MKTTVIACKTIEKELMAAMTQAGVSYDVIWLESGLHAVPRKLHLVLQEKLDEIRADRVIFALGLCGNSILGLKTGNYETVIPRADDCITLLIGSTARRLKLTSDLAAMFLSEGWLAGEQNLIREHEKLLERFDEETAEIVEEAMYANYRTLALLDCGTCDSGLLVDKTSGAAARLGLELKIVNGTLDYIKDLLTGPWTDKDRFSVLPPESCIDRECCAPKSGITA